MRTNRYCVVNERPTIKQFIVSLKVSSPGMTTQGPCQGGWVTAWKDSDGRVWSQLKRDNGKDCPLEEPMLEWEPKPKAGC